MFRLENHSTSEFVRRTAEIAENAEERLYGAYLDVLPVNRARTEPQRSQRAPRKDYGAYLDAAAES